MKSGGCRKMCDRRLRDIPRDVADALYIARAWWNGASLLRTNSREAGLGSHSGRAAPIASHLVRLVVPHDNGPMLLKGLCAVRRPPPGPCASPSDGAFPGGRDTRPA